MSSSSPFCGSFLVLTTTFLLLFTVLHVGTLPIATATTSSFGGGGVERDRVALLAFKSEIKHDPQGVVSSWNNSFHICEWEGITCSRRHKRVTMLDLSSRGLVGSLSPYIGNLSFLHQIMLSNNTLQGEIPPQVGRLFRLQQLSLNNNSFEGVIPANLSHCSNLIYLGVGGNKLVGKIPKELSSLSKLLALHIHLNNLMGGIPPFIGNLTSLVIISAAGNDFGGTIPDVFGEMKNLREFLFGSNKLSGMIPPSIYNLSSIHMFSLSRNQLRASLPPNLGLLFPHLQVLQLRENQFTGPLPLSLSNASKLQFLDMGGNSFKGKISTNFGLLPRLWRLNLGDNDFGNGEANEMDFIHSLANCSNLELVSLVDNRFRGMLPNHVATANLSTQLNFFAVSRNQITGVIPSWLGYLVNLKVLGLESNQFTGTIPTNIGNLQKLQLLAISTNRLSGKIPDSIGNLSLLNELHLEDNKLQGTIPSSLGNCQDLVLLNLSQNNLNGTIPKQLFDVSTLSIALNLAWNQFSGSLPSEVGNLKNLGELDVSENDLSGEIPSSLSGCTVLENLYLDGNFFEGQIPSSLISSRGIQNLDLSRNNLSGEIPKFLENLHFKNLNLSFNNFEGEVPREGVFLNASAISVVGNDKLCGGISELQLPKCTIKESKKQKISVAIISVISIASVLGVTMMVSSFVICLLKKKRKDKSSRSLLREPFLKVSYAKLLKATDGFSAANLIGKGSFGSVYKGILDQEGTIIAVKVLNLLHRGALKSFKAECEALRNIRHRNLVKIITSCSSLDFQGNDFIALVYEFMPNGSLESWVHSSPVREFQSLNLLQRVNIAIDVACGLDYLHHHCQVPIVHCDVKPSNVLLDHNMTAHVGDFGLARFLPELANPNQSSSIGIRGTVGYAAPEYGLGSEASTNGDVYSYGILLLEMMTGKRPTDHMFEEGHNLHNFARMAFPDRVMEIVDPILLNNDDEEEVATATNNNGSPRQAENGNRNECLISMIKIGVACSMESPQDRMLISTVVGELNLVRDNFQGTQASL